MINAKTEIINKFLINFEAICISRLKVIYTFINDVNIEYYYNYENLKLSKIIALSISFSKNNLNTNLI